MNQRAKILLFFMLQPTLASAHGEEILLPFFLSSASLLLFLVIIVGVSLPHVDKAVLAAVYLVTMSLAFYWGNEFYYRVGIGLITTVVVLAPITTTVLAHFLVQARRKKQGSE